MANNIVAYVGCESFDIILYISRILQKLGHKVLVVEHSETKALMYSIPQISGVDTERSCITYRRVDFTSKEIDLDVAEAYDDILIDCGFSCPKMDLSLLTKIVYVTDMFEYNMNHIGRLDYYDGCRAVTALLIRNAANTKITTKYIITKINKNVLAGMVSVLYRDDADYENSLLCHYNQVFGFAHISWTMKNYLLEEAKILCADSTDKQIKTAYLKARKGE